MRSGQRDEQSWPGVLPHTSDREDRHQSPRPPVPEVVASGRHVPRRAPVRPQRVPRVPAYPCQTVFDQAPGAPVPARGDSGSPVPEAGPIEIEVGLAHRGSLWQRRPAELEGLAEGSGHPNRRPGSGAHADHVPSHTYVKDPIPVGALGRHQRPVELRASRAERFRPLQMPAVSSQARRRAHGRTSGPHPIRLTSDRISCRLRKYGERIEVAFSQSSERQVPCRPVGKCTEARGGAARTRLRQLRRTATCDVLQLQPGLHTRPFMAQQQRQRAVRNFHTPVVPDSTEINRPCTDVRLGSPSSGGASPRLSS